PGGAADLLARLIGQSLSETFGQPLVVENKGGANGNIGGEMVARSAPDGYTLLMSSGSMVAINPHLYANMAFDPAKDLVPVASVARVPFIWSFGRKIQRRISRHLSPTSRPIPESATSARPESAALRILQPNCSRR